MVVTKEEGEDLAREFDFKFFETSIVKFKLIIGQPRINS